MTFLRKVLFSSWMIFVAVPPAFGQTATSAADKIPAWQVAAGGKLEFEVASVRENVPPKFFTTYSLDSDDDWKTHGNLFAADATLSTFISFAYRLSQMNSMLAHLPAWASSKGFDIQARMPGNPTKDQVRLMMQSLLADRFKLKIHFETQELPVLAVTLLKPGKLGPSLRLHADGPACTVVVPRGSQTSTPSLEMFPCNQYLALDEPDHAILLGARNTTAGQMAAAFSNVGRLGKPVVDQTGIVGKIDFAMEYTPDRPGSPAADSEFQGITFLEAVKDQLGLKLEPTRASISIPIVDHLESLSEN